MVLRRSNALVHEDEYHDSQGPGHGAEGDEVAFAYEQDGVKIVKGKRRRKGLEVVARLESAPWNPKLTTDELMKMTRGEPG